MTFPAALTAAARWSAWRRVDGRKVPRVPKDRPWLPFGRVSGSDLGFQLGDGWCGVDLDDVRDPETDEVIDPALEVLKPFLALGCYVAPSVSGRGVHVIGRTTETWTGVELIWPGPRVNHHNGSWWFAMVPGAEFGDPTRDVTEQVRALRAMKQTAQLPPPDPANPFAGYKNAAKETDDELLTSMVASDQGVKFLRLFRNEYDGMGYGSQSEADMALVTALAWWTNYDATRVDRIFRTSALYRDKWERADYRERTLRKAGCL